MPTVPPGLTTAPGPTTVLVREARKERTHRALLDAALELTEEVGLAGVSLRQVTEQILDSPDDELALLARAERQLTMVLVGAAGWRSGPSSRADG